ncbi:MAG: RnfABCDGE type electron transport complex subunit D [Ruminococcus sp.]|nr:RnfABCDGE type electron transport complex subunit D [Ruminococcus sp.]
MSDTEKDIFARPEGLDNGDADVPFIMAPAPFIHGSSSGSKTMAHVMVAMLPALIMSGIVFGGTALMLVGACTISAMGWEMLSTMVMRKHKSTDDLTAAVTGMLFGLTLPPTFPIIKAILGTFISIVIFKQLFGGVGKNILNPAAAGRLALYFIFKSDFVYITPMSDPLDRIYGSTPLVSGDASYFDLIVGGVPGNLGEVSALAAMLGIFYLLAMGVTGLWSTCSFVGTAYVFSLVTGNDGVYQILACGLLLTAVFMANDYVTTPLTAPGKILFGLGAGVITMTLRLTAGFSEACYAAILIMDLLTPLIDRATERRPRK